MSTAQQNTRVERLIEAIEQYIILAIAVQSGPDKLIVSEQGIRFKPGFDDVAEARQELGDALRDFHAPAFRVISGKPQVPEAEEDRLQCGNCKRHYPCIVPSCPHWAKATREAIATAPLPESDCDTDGHTLTPNDDPPEAA